LYSIFTICLLIVQIVVLILILTRVKGKDDEFVIANATLVNVVDNYYNMVLIGQVEELRKLYDLNPESKTNSLKPYTEKYNILLKNCSKEIMTSYLSKNCLSILLRYYSVESLALIIISNFKR